MAHSVERSRGVRGGGGRRVRRELRGGRNRWRGRDFVHLGARSAPIARARLKSHGVRHERRHGGIATGALAPLDGSCSSFLPPFFLLSFFPSFLLFFCSPSSFKASLGGRSPPNVPPPSLSRVYYFFFATRLVAHSLSPVVTFHDSEAEGHVARRAGERS